MTPAAIRRYQASEKGRLAAKRVRLKKKFNLSLEDHDAMLAAGHNRCWLCKLPSRNKYPLAVDHDHKTGLVRGILCHSCNTGIGMLKEDTALMQLAIEYLNANNALQEVVNG